MNIYHGYDYFSKGVDVQQRTLSFEALTNRFLELAEYFYKELNSREKIELVFDHEVSMDERNICLTSGLYIFPSASHILSVLC